MKKVIGIGNALTDVLINLGSDETLNSFRLHKGSMSLVDETHQRLISEATAGLPRTLSLGGAAANTIRAMAKLGGRTGFIGKVGNDRSGDYFLSALENLGIEPVIMRGGCHSGICVSLVSQDGERTMATFLGAALELSRTEVEKGVFEGYDYLYVEGYLVQDYELIEGIVSTAKQSGLKVAIDLASFNVVEENLEFLKRLVADHVDILFANEQEAHAFTGERDPMKATEVIGGMCGLTIVKIGMKGAYIKERGQEVLHVGVFEEARRVDTTGAGDFYAAGFMYGLCEELTLRQCGTIGSIAAGKVIEVVGTTFPEDIWKEIGSLVEQVRTENCLF